MADFSSNIGNYCPNNSGGGNVHESAQYGSPLKDVSFEHLVEYDAISPYGATAVLKICKHCGAVYGTSLTDSA